ncbi:putative flavin monooxygenase, FAD/NAD(P)-binding domain superfamily [Helianthus annuus]|uniref:Flavin-containing monooxygenase n=1 Tax=Helianthus annuus TaxID=4232 RepID=A0A9K3DJY4_HELAN|nr:flavin-containing monooxygenase FMO GS-OX5 isoform X2 [Helianthus annuus]KAF5756004.1 putative flavin monooxygenase, FAD/NAD(P)-binding domain superfamily [Helianthus annuus]KAJ0429609.1 putative flavin monooxygenase, FAD/NAD(P)-binding domain superfamily [Helianthus annuus]
MTNSVNVAVIGAGVAGLTTARELLRENHRVTVFEKSGQIGGTWVYDNRVEVDDCLHLNPNRTVVHSSIYKSLRTNLPRPLMGFSDFSLEEKTYGDPRLFPGHEEVLKFLKDFANEFGVGEVIRFNSEVVRVESGVVSLWWSGRRRRVVWWRRILMRWLFVMVIIPNHELPMMFLIVVVIGSGASAFDISREIATTAKEVHLSSRSLDVKVTRLDGYENIWQHMMIKRVFNDGTIEFQDGDSIVADAILHCTGYKFHFPFLRTNNMLHVDDNCVGPLYKHVFLPQLAPGLAFVGLTFNNGVIFRLLELQAKWVAQALSEKILLPSKDEMLADVYKFYQEMDENGIPKRRTHSLSFQFEYVDWLADQVGLHVEDRLKKMIKKLFENWMARPKGYRDAWVS